MTNNKWYEKVEDGSILQCDILHNFTITEVPIDSDVATSNQYNVIVMTQSCDITDSKHIILCPVWTRKEIEEQYPTFFADGKIGTLKKYQIVGYHPIDECNIEGFKIPWRVVQFKRIFEARKTDVTKHVKDSEPHLRLLSPYRELLTQEFARYFMRVGLTKPLKLKR